MCIANEQLGRRGKWLLAAANAALAAGLILGSVARPMIESPRRMWFDAAIGMLMGVSIGMNLMTIRKKRRGCLSSPQL